MKKCSNAYAVIGLGFGDEGKGLTVNALCQQLSNPLVIRYSGGQQAGHTVALKDGTKHVFSNFGSGTLNGIPTYWSKYCTLDPMGVRNEFNILKDKGITPQLYIDKKSPVTTPYDKFYNRNSKELLSNGTCGVGVGATYQREQDFHSLLVVDLFYPSVLKHKLKAIREYYNCEPNSSVEEQFLEDCEFVRKNFMFVDKVPDWYDNYIFESSQGLMLDQHFGFFPNVTRSNVGTKNILEMGFNPHLLLVTRAFQTRHGNGPMTNVEIPHNITYNPLETNVTNKYQGEFKKSLLDLDLLKYVMERDEYIKNSTDFELVVTCLDLVKNEHRYTVNGKIESHSNENSFIDGISKHLKTTNIHRISSPDGTFKLFKNPHE